MPSLATQDWLNGTNVTSPEVDIWEHLEFWFPPVCFLVGITGNTLCIAATCMSRSLVPSATRIYAVLVLLSADTLLTSAAVTWLGTSLVDYTQRVLAFDSAALNTLQSALLTDTGCQLTAFFWSGSLFVLVWLLVAMTTERYLTLARPFTVRRQVACKAVGVSVTVVVAGFGAAVTRFFTVTVTAVTVTTTGWIRRECGLTDLGTVLLLVDVLLLYLLPPVFLAVLAVCLSCMMCEYRRYRRRCQRSRPGRSTAKSARGELLAPPHGELAVTLASVYAAGLLPLFAGAVLTLVTVVWGRDPRVDSASAVTRAVARALVLLLAASHFVCFAIAGTRFRRVLGGILCGCAGVDPTPPLEGDGASVSMSAHSGSGASHGCSQGRGVLAARTNMAFDDRMQMDSTQL